MTQKELKTTLQKHFKNVFLFSMNDEVIHTGFSKMSHYNLALCTEKNIRLGIMMKQQIKKINELHFQRSSCRLCNSTDLEKVLDLRDIPVGEKYSNELFKEEAIRFPIDIYQCHNCKAVQTIDDIQSDYLCLKLYLFFRAE